MILSAVALVLAATATEEWEPLPPFNAETRSKVESSLRDKLFDGESARWRWLPAKDDGTTVAQYCGFVNAKNRIGGYVGFQPVWATGRWTGGKFKLFVSFVGGDSYGTHMATSMCKNAGYAMDSMPSE